MSDASSSSPLAPVPADTQAQRALDGVAVVLRPLVRWLLRHGVHYGTVAQVLKQVFLAEARAELARRGSKVTDSALSVLSGVHRKDVRALSGETLATAQLAATPASVLFTRWITDPRLRETPGDLSSPLRRRLPRQGEAPSFEALARETSSDVHPRTLLEELQRLQLATLDGDDVVLAGDHFVQRPEDEAAAQTLAVNAADHLAAAVHNLQPGTAGRFLEQSVYANGLSVESAEALSAQARTLWSPALQGMVAAARERVRADDARSDTPMRIRFGVYYFHEAVEAAPQAAPAGTDNTDKTMPGRAP